MALTAFVAGTGLLNCDLLYIGMSKIPDEGTEVYSDGFEMQLGGGTPAEMINLSLYLLQLLSERTISPSLQGKTWMLTV